jgi:hypothetical protein
MPLKYHIYLSKHHPPFIEKATLYFSKPLSLNMSQKADQSGSAHYVLMSALVHEPATELPCGIWDSHNNRATKDSSEMLPHVIC